MNWSTSQAASPVTSQASAGLAGRRASPNTCFANAAASSKRVPVAPSSQPLVTRQVVGCTAQPGVMCGRVSTPGGTNTLCEVRGWGGDETR